MRAGPGIRLRTIISIRGLGFPGSLLYILPSSLSNSNQINPIRMRTGVRERPLKVGLLDMRGR